MGRDGAEALGVGTRPSHIVAVLASSLLDEAGVLGGQFLAVDPGQEATH